MAARQVGGVWTKPEIAPFAGDYETFEPRITPGGERLYFTTSRPLPIGGSPMNICFLARKGDGWGEPQDSRAPLNPGKTMYVSVASDQTIFTIDFSLRWGKESIAVARPQEKTAAACSCPFEMRMVPGRNPYPWRLG